MNESPPNIFNALFKFHPRDGHTPKENFLSEAFAYILLTSDAARDAWLSLALGQQVLSEQFELTTRQSERDEEGAAIFPDMRIWGVMSLGKPFDLYSEHKWNSPCNSSQIRAYIQVAKNRGAHCNFVFIGASNRQKRDAERGDPCMKGRAFLWEDIYRILDQLEDKSEPLKQFLIFMKTHGLSPGKPINQETMVAFIRASGFLQELENFANRLNDDFDWDFFPKRYRSDEARKVTSKWGRTAIEFATPEWKPTITAGFLHNEWDHGVSFIDPTKGIDLLLRIEASPTHLGNAGPTLADLNRRKKSLLSCAASALTLKENGNDNNHSILIIRSSLADVIGNASSQQSQIKAVHEKLKEWGQILFGDGALEGALKQSGLDSGM